MSHTKAHQPLMDHILWAMPGGIITDEEGIQLYRLKGIDSMGHQCGWIVQLDGINRENTVMQIAEARMATPQECEWGGVVYLPEAGNHIEQMPTLPARQATT